MQSVQVDPLFFIPFVCASTGALEVVSHNLLNLVQFFLSFAEFLALNKFLLKVGLFFIPEFEALN